MATVAGTEDRLPFWAQCLPFGWPGPHQPPFLMWVTCLAMQVSELTTLGLLDTITLFLTVILKNLQFLHDLPASLLFFMLFFLPGRESINQLLLK